MRAILRPGSSGGGSFLNGIRCRCRPQTRRLASPSHEKGILVRTLMSIPELLFSYVSLLLAALAGDAIFSEVRRRRVHPAPSQDRIFRCRGCGYVYTYHSELCPSPVS